MSSTKLRLPDRTDIDMQEQRRLQRQRDDERRQLRWQGYVNNDMALTDRDRAFQLKMLMMEGYLFQLSARRNPQGHHPHRYDLHPHRRDQSRHPHRRRRRSRYTFRGQEAVRAVFHDIDFLIHTRLGIPDEEMMTPQQQRDYAYEHTRTEIAKLRLFN